MSDSKWTPEMEKAVEEWLKLDYPANANGPEVWNVDFRIGEWDLWQAALAELRRLRDTVKTLSIALDLAIMTRPEGGRNE